MEDVRDKTINYWEMVFEGKMKDQESKLFYEVISKMDKENQKWLKKIIVQTVDKSVFNLLWLFEEEEKYSILQNETEEKIEEISDGLTGELFSEDGWIAKYSTKETNDVLEN